MTAKVESKVAPKWKQWLGRLVGQPTPFWRKRLDDRIGQQRNFDFIRDATDQVAVSIARIIAILITSGVVMALLVLVVPWIFFAPGFLEDGLAAPIGAALAGVCLATGNCDIRYLLAGSALAVPMTVSIVMILSNAFYWRSTEDDEAEVSEEELHDGLSVIDERIVRLRADMVLAGLLPLSPEEKEED